MRVLVAPGAFKGTMTARQAAKRLSRDFSGAELRHMPMADGGDDTVDVLVGHGWSQVTLASGVTVAQRDDVVVVELARICGMRTLTAPNPWGASTWALGVALRDVAALAPRQVMLALGGSASTDGGLGMLSGIRGDRESGGLTDLVARVAVDQPVQIPPLPYDLSALVDVLRPLTGPLGAAHAFGPQ